MSQIIDNLLKKYFSIGEYTIDDGLVSTTGSVKLYEQHKVLKLPVKFNSVGKNFDCANNSLTSLTGVPQSVGGWFTCYNNNLTSLIGSPQSVSGWFNCSENSLTSLEGAPESILYFACDWKSKLPLLRLMKYKNVAIYDNKKVNEIISKYCGRSPLKGAIWDCAKELRVNGFADNAKW
jgi:hypothetical protein